MQISQVKMCKDVHFDRACGCFLYAPSIYAVSLQKLTEVCASTALSHRQNYTSVYSFDYEFRHRRNIAAAWNYRHPWRCCNKASTYQTYQGCSWFYAEMRCSKSCYLCDLELVDL
ncbi:MAG: hypothetical protein ACTTI6_05860, partial [Treponema sp.]